MPNIYSSQQKDKMKMTKINSLKLWRKQKLIFIKNVNQHIYQYKIYIIQYIFFTPPNKLYELRFRFILQFQIHKIDSRENSMVQILIHDILKFYLSDIALQILPNKVIQYIYIILGNVFDRFMKQQSLYVLISKIII
ncbi:hypothetical protein pb186bvf_005841 [Paramecium bursaria]